jgi:hypothetical protein
MRGAEASEGARAAQAACERRHTPPADLAVSGRKVAERPRSLHRTP